MGNYMTDFWQGMICESHVGNTGFNGFDLNKEFPKGRNPKRGIPRWLMGIPFVTVARGIPKIQDGGLIQSKEAKFWNLKLMQLHTVKGQQFLYIIFMH